MAAISRARAALGLLLTTALAIIALPAPAATAQSVDVVCTGTETVAYQPGLLLTPQTVHVVVTGTLTPCHSSDAGITAGGYQDNFAATLSCATLLAPRPGTRVVHWSNGRSSTFTYDSRINDAGGQTTVTFSGVITGGEFTGDRVVEQVAFVTPAAAQCLASPGLTTLGPGPVVLTIAGV